MDKIVQVKRKEVYEFLKSIKVIENKNFHIIKRLNDEKNPDILLGKLGIDYNDLINEIKKLTIADFLRCQLDSKNKFLFMYIFLKNIQNILVFIKLSIIQQNDEKVYVISFHEAEFNELDKRPYK